MEKRVSRHTLSAYTADLSGFLEFLTGYQGRPPRQRPERRPSDRLPRLAVAAGVGRAGDSQPRPRAVRCPQLLSLAGSKRAMHNPAIGLLQAPKLPARLPKPLTEGDAANLLTTAEEWADEPWIGKRDRALFTLLYGCGLQIDEALSLNRRDMPGETLLVTGKGRKQRMIPVLPVVREALETYVAACPYALVQRWPAVRRDAWRTPERRRRAEADAWSSSCDGPAGYRHSARPAPQLRDPPAGRRQRLCAPFRISSAMPPCRAPSSTRTWMRNRCSGSTRTPTRGRVRKRPNSRIIAVWPPPYHPIP